MATKKAIDPAVEEQRKLELEQKATEEAARIQKNRQEIISMLKAHSREGMDMLIEEMDNIGFFEAPASGGNHCHYPGGLAQHSLNVARTASDFALILYQDEESGENYTHHMDSIVVAALLHDLGKCGDYGKRLYVDNILKSGNRSESKPYKRNKDLIPTPHGMKSYDIANRFIDLTEEEEAAIKYHDGFFERANSPILTSMTKIPQLLMVIHWADMWSSQVLEDGAAEEEE